MTNREIADHLGLAYDSILEIEATEDTDTHRKRAAGIISRLTVMLVREAEDQNNT